MKAFMDKEFMLQSPTAQHLYHAYAEDMPICDYHCHIPWHVSLLPDEPAFLLPNDGR